MDLWFLRPRGDTWHNDPSTPNYVPGEPPDFPETLMNYREICLSGGFVRMGWPNTGDLRNMGHQRLAPDGYTFNDLEERGNDLMKFASIRVGDFILIPADIERGDVHLGLVVLRNLIDRQITCMRSGLPAYYFYHDVLKGEWYECSHRVDVLWDRLPEGTYAVHSVDGLPWRLAFAQVKKAKDKVIALAKRVGFPV